jgi:hypothetical protein
LIWLLCLGVADASPLFDDDAVLHVELRGPLGAVLGGVQNRVEHPFVLSVDGADLDVTVRVRGKSRVVACEFPPLRLKFDGPDDTVFAGQHKLKLVTHCNKAASYETGLLKEYVAYRIFALLTGSAVRVRLLRVRYVDTDEHANKPIERFAFLLEPDADLAQRIGGELVDLKGVVLGRLAREQVANVFVAQYLIGNTDYSLVTAEGEDTCCHNGILVDVEGELHYVPYDFDRAKFVDASYARTPGSGARARARRYVGYCMDDLDLEAAIGRVGDARERIFSEIEAVEAISGRKLKGAGRFLKGFFRAAEDSSRLSERFEKTCLD